MIEILAQITNDGPRPFCCGIVLWDDKVCEAAAIVKYMKGWRRDRVREYCKNKNWTVAVVWTMERDRT